VAFLVLFSMPRSAQAQLLTGFFGEGDDGSAMQQPVQEPHSAPVTPAPVAKDIYLTSNTSVDVYPVWEDRARVLSAVSEPPPVMTEEGSDEGEPVDLQADKMEHNDQTQVITASGNVMLEQSGRILRADRIEYNLLTDRVRASGDVVLNERNGDIYYADDVILQDKLKSGFVEGLKTYLTDGSRFQAESGERKNGVTTIMKTASYTPCEPCKEDPDKDPLWQIKASKVTHDEQEKRISYQNARFEVLGVPVAYTPFFSHPDGTVEQKSGFLSPTFGYKSDLGTFFGSEYYWGIGPDQDATFGITAYSNEAPLGELEYRQRWENASLKFSGGVTYSSREAQRGDTSYLVPDETRGYVFTEGLWDINEKWRGGLNVAWASDDQFMRQYDITSKDVLENELYVERFSGRDYFVGRFLSFQDLRVDETPVDQPKVLPEAQASFVGEPGSVPYLGGRWSFGTDVLSLVRGGTDQDVVRFGFDVGWYRRFVSDYGLLLTVDANARTDAYDVNDREVALIDTGRDPDSSAVRFFPQAYITASYPLTRQFEGGYQALIEPKISFAAAPNVEVLDDDIPNEDSQDVQLDTSNLFEADRFAGRDRVEDRSRLTYGLRTGLYDNDGSNVEFFGGQSIRFHQRDNPFPAGSGLDTRESDFVGQVSGTYKTNFYLNYKFQLNNKDFEPERHEVDTSLDLNRFSLSSRYLFASALDGTDITEGREQIDATLGYYLNEEWRARASETYDLGEDPGLRKASLGLDYFGQCLSWSVTGTRSLTTDIAGDNNTSVIFRIGLKNLGDFKESGFRVDPDSE